MKLITHYAFAVGLLALAFPHQLLFAVLLGIAVNFIIDLGHASANGLPRRSYLTHSVFTAPLIGFAVGAITAYLGLSAGISLNLAVVSLMGVLSALAHLLLDSITEGGIFIFRNRFALAHFKYNNAVLNIFFLLIGIGMFFLGLFEGV
ncbi:MAG: DUF1286 domain-containing protein [Nitrososphaeria archaeon]